MESCMDMNLIEVIAGSFQMGQADGDFDERPVHSVCITRPYFMATTPVTNGQYEQFNPDHKRYRGMRGVSKGDDDAVTYVSWHDAVAFCNWLSEKKGRPYRLPTEAEWEYACRAGTFTDFHTGKDLPVEYHRNQPIEGDWASERAKKDDDLRAKKGNVPVSLAVGRSPANAWGFRDMHGLVEEWCHDWYGRYPEEEETDPVGRASGLFKVTRGGSHNTYMRHLRSANRLGTVPEDGHWIIGFRVVQAALPSTAPLPAEAPSWNDASVEHANAAWEPVSSDTPVFEDPIIFVNRSGIDEELAGLTHNHHPNITWCPNGDLLAVWFATRSEIGREMQIVSSRLRRRGTECEPTWEPLRRFFSAPDRNNTGSTLFTDDKGRLFFFGTISESTHHHDQLLFMVGSDDSGKTWSAPRVISSLEDRHKYTPLPAVFRAQDESLVLSMDTAPLGYPANECGSGVFVSPDQGSTWIDRISHKTLPEIGDGKTSGLIAGFHTAIVQLKDGRLLALARTHVPGGTLPIEGRMPQSLSSDMGETWTYSASPFPPIGQGQRPAMLRLTEGPIVFVSFCNEAGDQP